MSMQVIIRPSLTSTKFHIHVFREVDNCIQFAKPIEIEWGDKIPAGDVIDYSQATLALHHFEINSLKASLISEAKRLGMIPSYDQLSALTTVEQMKDHLRTVQKYADVAFNLLGRCLSLVTVDEPEPESPPPTLASKKKIEAPSYVTEFMTRREPEDSDDNAP